MDKEKKDQGKKEKEKSEKKEKKEKEKKEKEKAQKKEDLVDTRGVMFSENRRHALISGIPEGTESPSLEISEDQDKSMPKTTEKDKKKDKPRSEDKKDKKAKEHAELLYSGAPYDLVKCVQKHGIDPLKPNILKKLSGLEFKDSPYFKALKSKVNHPETWTRETLYRHIFVLRDDLLYPAFNSYVGNDGYVIFTLLHYFETMMEKAETDYFTFMLTFNASRSLFDLANLEIKHKTALEEDFQKYWDENKKTEKPLSDAQKSASYKWWQKQKVKATEKTHLDYSGAPFDLVECVHKHGINPLKQFVLTILNEEDFRISEEFNQMEEMLTSTDSSENIYIDICMESNKRPREKFRDYLANHKANAGTGSTVRVTMLFQKMLKTEGTDYINFMNIFDDVIQELGEAGIASKDQEELKKVFHQYWDRKEKRPRQLRDDELEACAAEWEKRMKAARERERNKKKEAKEKEDNC